MTGGRGSLLRSMIPNPFIPGVRKDAFKGPPEDLKPEGVVMICPFEGAIGLRAEWLEGGVGDCRPLMSLAPDCLLLLLTLDARGARKAINKTSTSALIRH